ncbi:MAG: hypothetical protein GY791_21255 [Alphaproteobacteria bacterium]|nr:hypothetical protein [Alphaproteobacteria bacterium]
MRILATAIILAASLTAWTTGAGAQNLSIKAFYGHYSGGGVAESPDSLFFDVTARDLDVVIEPASSGFRVAWTTVLRKGGDPNNPEIVKRTTEISFQPTDKPNIFVEKRSVTPFDGTPLSWARIEGQTLSTYTFVIEDDGVYSLASYARTVSAGGMDLVFTSIRDGQPVRSVKAKLIKQGN